MKLLVAVLLGLSIFSSGFVAQEQRAPRGSNKSAVSKPRSETIRICQGVPIPDGYIVIAYMTSSACAHGAYVLKKQSQNESSLAVNGSARQTSAAVKTTNTPEKPSTATDARQRPSSQARNSEPNTTLSNKPQVTEPQTLGDSGSAGVASRPRRVSSSGTAVVNQSDTARLTPTDNDNQRTQAPPTLIGSEPVKPLRPPTLGNAGSGGRDTSDDSSAKPAAQPTPEDVDEGDVVRVDTTLVTVPVSVLDRQGRFIPNLTRQDFSLFENGVEQSIAYFEPAEKPFTVALLLDTSPSTHFHLSEIRQAAIEFAKQLRPQDRVLIVSFSNEVLLLTPEATNDLNTVSTVIDEYANTGTSTRLYDAIDLTIQERLNNIKGRKAIVLFTDGVDTSSQQATYQTTLREVEELDALIYPVQYDTSDYLRAMQGLGSGTVTVVTRRSNWPFGSSTQTYTVPANGGAPLPGATRADYDRADQYLHALADKTGGRLYQANDTSQLAAAFTQIAEELRRQYSLGYYPKAGGDGSERRQIHVRVRQPDLAVRARDSYVKTSAPSANK